MHNNTSIDNNIHVTGVGYYKGFTGYNIHTGNFFSELANLVSLEQVDLQDIEKEFAHKIEKVKSLFNTRPENHYFNIQINYGNQPFIDEVPGSQILYTVWESTKLPDDWLSAMNEIPYIWTPSEWGRQVMKDNGLSGERIHVVPEGVDTSLFNPEAAPLEGLSKFPGFKFIHIGKYEDRKGTELLIRAFDDHFHGRPDVFLVVLSHNPFIANFDINQAVDSLNLKSRNKVLCVSPLAHTSQVVSLMTACDAAVFPSRAEGWGLPIMEAMACGLPTITTSYSAPVDYANDENAYLLNCTMTDIKEPYFERSDGNYGQWAQPDRDHLIHLMDKIISNPEKAVEKGKKAAHDMNDKWQWKHAAEKAYEILKGYAL